MATQLTVVHDRSRPHETRNYLLVCRRDPAHFNYSTFAKSASQRRDNLRASADGLKVKLEAALRERDEALEQVARADSPAGHDQLRNRRRAERAAAAALR